MTILDPLMRPLSHCQIYGHTWRTTAAIGWLICSLCEKLGYCPECLKASHLPFPHNAVTVRCTQHISHPVERRNG